MCINVMCYAVCTVYIDLYLFMDIIRPHKSTTYLFISFSMENEKYTHVVYAVCTAYTTVHVLLHIYICLVKYCLVMNCCMLHACITIALQ